MESKITQSQNQSAKLATTKHITYTHLPMEKTHMHGRKESQSLIVKLSNAHRPAGKKSLTMQNCFKKNHGEKKNIATLHTLLTSQPLWNSVSIGSPTWMID